MERDFEFLYNPKLDQKRGLRILRQEKTLESIKEEGKKKIFIQDSRFQDFNSRIG